MLKIFCDIRKFIQKFKDLYDNITTARYCLNFDEFLTRWFQRDNSRLKNDYHRLKQISVSQESGLELESALGWPKIEISPGEISGKNSVFRWALISRYREKKIVNVYSILYSRGMEMRKRVTSPGRMQSPMTYLR